MNIEVKRKRYHQLRRSGVTRQAALKQCGLLASEVRDVRPSAKGAIRVRRDKKLEAIAELRADGCCEKAIRANFTEAR